MSHMRTSIKCNCGQRIIAKDVVQHGYYLRLFGPSFVYVKFRCSRCKKLGEQFIKQEEWEEGILKDTAVEASHNEKEQFAAKGAIDINEVIDFHFELETLNDLKSLEALIPPKKKVAFHAAFLEHITEKVLRKGSQAGAGCSPAPAFFAAARQELTRLSAKHLSWLNN